MDEREGKGKGARKTVMLLAEKQEGKDNREKGSATILYMYLIAKKNYTLNNARFEVKQKRSILCPNIHFQKILIVVVFSFNLYIFRASSIAHSGVIISFCALVCPKI